MNDEWISLNEYCKRYKVGPEQAKKLIEESGIEVRKTKGGYYKIRVADKNLVTRAEYEKVLERAIRAETILENIRATLV